MYEKLNCYTDRILSEYNKTNNEAFAYALTLFYADILHDPKFEAQRKYCEKRMLEYKGKGDYLDGYCEALFNLKNE